MKKVNELLDQDKEYYLIISDFDSLKEYGMISKRRDIVESVKDFVKFAGNGRHNVSVTLHESKGSDAIAQTELQVCVEFSIKEI